MNLRPRRRDKSDLHTSALNDILFILLFFFLIVATLANPNVIRLAIPKGKSDTKAKQSVVVSVDARQQFFVDGMPVAREGLETALAAKLQNETDAEPTVVINIDSSANVAQMAAVMRAAQHLKAKTVLAVDNN